MFVWRLSAPIETKITRYPIQINLTGVPSELVGRRKWKTN